MTSTTSSKSKFKQGLSLFLWSLYTGKTTMIIYLAILTFFSFASIVIGVGFSTDSWLSGHSEDILEGITVFALQYVFALSFIFTFVFSVKEFSYLHDKRKTDMFGALPASRRTIFFPKLAAVIAQSAAPMLIILTVLAIINGGSIRDFFNITAIVENTVDNSPQLNLWYVMIKMFVGIVVNAAFLGFLSVCCGKTSDKILSYLIINAAYPISALLIQLLPASFVIGYDTQLNEWISFTFCPASAMFTLNPIYWGIFALVFGALSFFLLPHRKAECAQSHFAFKAPLIITKVLVSFAVGIVSAYLFGMIFSMIGGDKIAFCAGMIIGSFTAYFIIQIIFAKGFKRFGWGMIPYAVMIGCFAVLMLVLNTGMLGYESYVPNVDDVESVSLVGDKQIKIDGEKAVSGRITNKKQIEECIAGHKEAIEFLKKRNPSFSELTINNRRLSDDYIDFDNENLVFFYKLKNGATVTRDYGIMGDNDIDFINSETYLNNTNKLFLIDPRCCTSIEIYSDDYEDIYEKENDEYYTLIKIDGVEYGVGEGEIEKSENQIKIIEALRKDIIAYGTAKSKKICNLDIEYGGGDALFDEYEYVDVKSSYKNTLSFLKSISKRIEQKEKAAKI